MIRIAAKPWTRRPDRYPATGIRAGLRVRRAKLLLAGVIATVGATSLIRIGGSMFRHNGAALAALLVLVVLAPTPSHAASSDEAAKFVDGLGQRAFQALNQTNLPLEQKEAQVRTLLADNFDLKLIGRYVVGQSWRTMGEEQQEAYLNLFEEYVLRTYSKRLGGYSGQQFQIAGVKSASPEDHIVSTVITRPGAPPVEAAWRVQAKAIPYKIVDVMVAGVSMVVTQRSEFGSVIQRQGVDGLIESLRMQVSKIPAQAK